MDNLWSFPSEFKTADICIYIQFDPIAGCRYLYLHQFDPIALTSTMPIHSIINDDSVINVQSNYDSFILLLKNEEQDFTFEVSLHTPVYISTSSDFYFTMI